MTESRPDDLLRQLLRASTDTEAVDLVKAEASKLTRNQALVFVSRLLAQTLSLLRRTSRIEGEDLELGVSLDAIEGHSMGLVLDLLEGREDFYSRRLQHLTQFDQTRVSLRAAAHLAGHTRTVSSIPGALPATEALIARMRFGAEAFNEISRISDTDQ